jgi:hypothetical protein
MQVVDSILVGTLILMGVPAAFSITEEPMRTVTLYHGHATMEIPRYWNDISAESLEFFSLRAAEASGGRSAEIYQYGFRPDDPQMDFALPQILIQIRESGRLPYGRFLHLPTLDEIQEEGKPHLADRAGPMLRGIELEAALFDRRRYAIYLTNTLDLAFEGRVSVTTASFLTERGLFTLHCYAGADQAPVMAPLFDRIIDSVRFDDELHYQPKLGDRWPPRPSTIAYGAAALIAIILIFIVIRSRRHRS